MDELEKGFDHVTNTSKLLITLSTTFLGFSVTFVKKVEGLKFETCWDKITISFSYLFFVITIGFGIWALLGVTTVLQPKEKLRSWKFNPSIRDNKISTPFMLQIVSFALAAMFLMLFSLGKIWA